VSRIENYDIAAVARTIRNHEGYVGAFTREQAPGAIPNGATVVKQSSEPKDGNSDGAHGIVLGSIYIDEPDPRWPDIRHVYWVEWENYPRWAATVIDRKVRAA
jgi:hypothetical protein